MVVRSIENADEIRADIKTHPLLSRSSTERIIDGLGLISLSYFSAFQNAAFELLVWCM